MPTVAKCPECTEPMRLSDAAAGKRVRCPGCKHIFVAPGEEEEPEVVECDIVEEPAKPPPRRPSRDEEEEDDRPRRSSRRDDEDEEDDRPRRRRRDEEEDRPAKRRRRRIEKDASAPSGPIICGILSCALCCMPIFAIPLAHMAIRNANEEMDRLPNGRRYESAHQQLRLARTLGTIGLTLSLTLMVVALIIRIATWT